MKPNPKLLPIPINRSRIPLPGVIPRLVQAVGNNTRETVGLAMIYPTPPSLYQIPLHV